jgi:branched-chain amino acid transport system ATP-binding protein
MPADLPWGVQRRLEIARAFLRQPALLLLDEPAAGMNEDEVEDLARVLRLLRERGITMLLVEHVMDLVMPLSDRIAVLDHGEKIAEGTPDEIRRNERALAAYLG